MQLALYFNENKNHETAYGLAYQIRNNLALTSSFFNLIGQNVTIPLNSSAEELQFEEIIWHNFERKTKNGKIRKV